MGVPLLAVGILISWMGFKDAWEEAGENTSMQQTGTASGQNLSGNDPRADSSMVKNRAIPRTAAKPDVASGTGTADHSANAARTLSITMRIIAGYRLRKADIRRSDYRNGESSVAENLLQRIRTVAVSALKQHLRKSISSNQ